VAFKVPEAKKQPTIAVKIAKINKNVSQRHVRPQTESNG
jgi:hypothetical protein